MKVITIKEPWASLIINGYKNYEFRTWKNKYRGKVLIHSSKSFDKVKKEKFNKYDLSYSNGQIIGEAYITDCILVDEKMDGDLRKIDNIVYGSDHVNLYAFKLDNIVKYDNKINIKGNLGLWNYEGDEIV